MFKIFSFTMALEDHTLKSLDELFTIGQGYKLGKFTIHEAEHMPAMLAARDILPSPPTSARRRSCCAAAPPASANSLPIWAC